MIALQEAGGPDRQRIVRARMFAVSVQALGMLGCFWCQSCVQTVEAPVPMCGRLACPMCKKPNTLVICLPNET